MPLTPECRAELEALGPDLVRQKLLEAGGIGWGTALRRFAKSDAHLLRGDVEDWLAKKHGEEASIARRTLWAAIIAAIVGIASLGVAVATLWFTIWPRQ